MRITNQLFTWVIKTIASRSCTIDESQCIVWTPGLCAPVVHQTRAISLGISTTRPSRSDVKRSLCTSRALTLLWFLGSRLPARLCYLVWTGPSARSGGARFTPRHATRGRNLRRSALACCVWVGNGRDNTAPKSAAPRRYARPALWHTGEQEMRP